MRPVILFFVTIFFGFFSFGPLPAKSFFDQGYNNNSCQPSCFQHIYYQKTDYSNPVIDTLEWIKLFSEVFTFAAQGKFKIETTWTGRVQDFIFSGKSQKAAMSVTLMDTSNNEALVTYLLIPGQQFSMRVCNNLSERVNFLTVNDLAIIYRLDRSDKLTQDQRREIRNFEARLGEIIDYDYCQRSIPLPSRISDTGLFQNVSFYPYYINIHTGDRLAGKRLEFLRDIAGNRMIKLDISQDDCTFSQWYLPEAVNDYEISDTTDQELVNIFRHAIERSIKNRAYTWDVYYTAQDRIKRLFKDNDSLANKFISRLERWMVLYEAHVFPGYHPKTTPDVILDFRPQLITKIYDLPEPKLENLPQLINLFDIYSQKAQQNPGQWVEGNMILGADPQEYNPSDQELILFEIGDRINEVLEVNTTEDIQKFLRENGIAPRKLEYKAFTFRHVDVMGSGRFFYVDVIRPVVIMLP